MSRFYLILFFSALSATLFSQQELKKFLDFAYKKQAEGDYVHALKYYRKAMNIDSNSIQTLWNYAETLRAYKDYPKAAYYYKKVYGREDTKLYPSSLLQYGLMLKQCGNYDEALKIFQLAKKKYRNDSRGYLSRKSRAEIQSCIWAKSNINSTSSLIFEDLPEQINSKNAEFGHIINGNKLIFSSLRADSISAEEEVYDPTYNTHLYMSEIKDGIYKDAEIIEELNWENASSGNGTFSSDKKRFYFSYCHSKQHNYQCKILVAYIENDKFTDIDTLGEIINYQNANTTMPFIGDWDGNEVLFFASDREGGSGGMDIWYSFIKDGNQFSKPINIKRINTPDDELSPFWNNQTLTLYFSSSWHPGFGGQDIFKSTYDNNFNEPQNLGMPINSPANDLYYFKTSTGDSAYFSSNRLGSNYSKNPTCCSDIFMVRKKLTEVPPTEEETLEELNKRLPVSLYFHNDIPNPRSWDTISAVNYIDSYNEYLLMLDKYKKEYSSGLKGEKAADAKDDIEDFFIEYVEHGVKDLELFRDLLLKELDRGNKIEMIVKGFASPLAKTDYNINLTKRRISSLVNYFKIYNNGVFLKYLQKSAGNGGELTVKEVPFGEYSASSIVSDNPNDLKNSVYSRMAASERKIEIQSVNIIHDRAVLISDNLIYNEGKQKSGALIKKEFTIRNLSNETIIIDDIIPSDHNLSYNYKDSEIPPKGMMIIEIQWATDDLLYSQMATVELIYNNKKDSLKLTITAELE